MGKKMLHYSCTFSTSSIFNTMQQFIVRKEIHINATPAAVWDALTNPEKTKEYFFNCEVSSDWKPGSPISFKGKVLLIKKIEMHGTILEIVPEKRLRYNLGNSGDEGEEKTMSTVTDELSYNNGITTLSITDDVGDGEGAAERFEKSEQGWEKVLSGLKKLVEKDH